MNLSSVRRDDRGSNAGPSLTAPWPRLPPAAAKLKVSRSIRGERSCAGTCPFDEIENVGSRQRVTLRSGAVNVSDCVCQGATRSRTEVPTEIQKLERRL